ncbi:MAG: nicotinate-nucleotide--dimethylbenzimidazole phosphoribosyltransferase [Armatimonadia bacterium]|nr:nicotinate-nucleotide--dimethylbenzimidazole phosphoribosyltransferase [Armatimonadia bacterium]
MAQLIESVPPPIPEAATTAAVRQKTLTKPPGSLGRLEELAIRLAGMTGELVPDLAVKRVFVLAADHGVTDQAVSPYPSSVTGLMVANFARGGAAINVLARHGGAEIVVADVGVGTDLGDLDGVVDAKVARGTADMTHEPAMTEEQLWEAVRAGVALVRVEKDLGLAATGEMGIGNTTAATAIACALLDREPEEMTGPGAGLPEEGVRHKSAVVTAALLVNRPDHGDPWEVLAKLGGLEIAGLVGVILACAARRVPCVIDGFISTAAALVAARACPPCTEYMMAGHRSAEPAHGIMLEALQLEPVLDLGMRLGEGTGAMLAMHVIEAAAKVLGEMATFAEAGIDTPPEE